VRAHEARMVLKVFEAMLDDWRRLGKGIDKEAIGRFLRSCLLGGDPEVATELRQLVERSGVIIDAQMEKLFRTWMHKSVARKS